MGSELSLFEAMNAVSRQLDQAAEKAPSSAQGMSEMDAFLTLDPLLSDLNKQYLDARGTRLQAEKEYGRDDGMAAMARDMEDSAWCALQTRYMEARAERRLMAQAQFLMEETREREEAKARREKERAALERMRDMELIARAEKENSSINGADLWLLMMFIIAGERTIDAFRFAQPTYSFNRIAA